MLKYHRSITMKTFCICVGIHLFACQLLLLSLPVYAHGDSVSGDSASADSKTSTDFIREVLSFRPLYAAVQQSNILDGYAGITEAQIGFDGEVRVGKHASVEYLYSKSRSRTQYLSLGVGYKNYPTVPEASFPFINATIMKQQGQSTLSGGLVVGYYATLFEKRTTFFSDVDIDWVNLGLELGGDFAQKYGDIRLAPVVHLGLGCNTNKIDTLVFRNLPEQNKDVLNVDFLSAGLLLYGSYKDFDVKVETGAKGAIKTHRSWYAVECSYTLWVANEKHHQNNLRLFIAADNCSFTIDKEKENNKTETLYKSSISTVRAGLSFRVMRILPYK